MTLWFLRLFSAFRDLEARHDRLREALGLHYPPTSMGVSSALGVTARAVLPPCIAVEVAHEFNPKLSFGMVRIVLQERGNP